MAVNDLLRVEPGEHRAKGSGIAVLAYGFRPFFLLASLHAAIVIPLWIAVLQGVILLPGSVSGLAWHAHEMLYGFVAAAVAGFLLTAVPNWTSRSGYSGAPLAGLVLLWTSGRVAMTFQLGMAPLLVALIDLAFIPALGLTLLPSLIRSGNRGNLVFIALLGLMFASNLHFHLSGAMDTGALLLGFNTMLLMVAILGGRVIPAFTSAGLKQLGVDIQIRRFQGLDKLVLLVISCILVIDLLVPGTLYSAALAALAAVLLALQLKRWCGHRTLRIPIIWVLHVAYAWLPVCLGLKAFGLVLPGLPAISWLHALTAGALATMIIGIMSRASLGHTGRELVVVKRTIASYYLITGAALARVFGPLLAPLASSWWLGLSSLLWFCAFLMMLWVYAPILCSPRIDGRPG